MRAFCTTKKRSGQAFHYYQTAKSETRQVISVAATHEAVERAVNEFVITDDYKDAIIDRIKKEIKAKEAQRKKELKGLNKEAEQSRSRILNLKMSLADGNITGEEYREVKGIIETRLNQTNSTIRDLEERGNKVNEILLRIIESLTRLDFIYKNALPEWKQELLLVIFPKGFSIDKSSGKVRTSILNVYLTSMCSKTGGYEHIINKKGEAFTASPILGV